MILIFVEAIAFFGAVTNFAVPGTWHDFWAFEVVLVTVGVASGVLSIYLERRTAIRERGSSSLQLWQRLQFKILVIGVSIVAVLLAGHSL
jgi:hypothetical protein